MAADNVNDLLEEITSNQGLIRIDQDDVDDFKAVVDVIDAEKVSGTTGEIGELFDRAISSIVNRNDDKPIRRVIYFIQLPAENCFIDLLEDVSSALNKMGEEVEYQWGLSTANNLQGDQMLLTVVIGF